MKNFVAWFTGIPASGKSTIAKKVCEKLKDMGIKIEILESDEVRKVITPKPLYSDEERDWFYGTVLIWLAELLYRNGINVIIDATGHKAWYREKAREKFRQNFLEIYIKCSVETAMKRDPKGLYKAALEGRIKTLPGLQVPYEEPTNPDLVLDTEKLSINECVEKFIQLLKGKGFI